MVPESPTAQTSVGPTPQTPESETVVPLATLVHEVPAQWTVVPPNTYQINGNTVSVTVPSTTGNQYYRLHKP